MRNCKEYLVKNLHGEYVVTDGNSGFELSELIEILEGAECAILVPDNIIYFWKSNLFIGGIREGWVDMGTGYDANWYLNTVNGSKIIWQRATHPEELPFVDDEPKSLNDQYAEIERVRQGVIKVSQNPNQQPREIQKNSIEGTLAERQTQYGCYEDVAQVTQQILSALRIGNYDKLPAPMKESLHMIASKMARIVNGDPEYFDNWHDIGGYAKLIEKLIKGE